MKKPTQREARELAERSKTDGALFIVFYNKSGRPAMTFFQSIDKRKANRVLKAVLPKGKMR